jgi:flagellar protein FlgJ
MNISPTQPATPLERLAHHPALSEQEKIAEASRQFEAVLLRQILAEAQKPLFKSKFTDHSFAADVYRDLTVQHLADALSRHGSFGLAQTLTAELNRPASTP